MMWMCCCAKARKDGDDTTMGGIETKLKNANRILIEFVIEESKIGLKEISCLDLVEKVLLVVNKNEIPKKDLLLVYKAIDPQNDTIIKSYLV